MEQQKDIEKIDKTKPDEQKKEEPAKKASILDPETQLKKLSQGEFQLYAPIRAGGKDITVLEYDFQALTGWEIMDALDSDPKATNIFRVTNKQAMMMFAMAVAKKTPGIDATDIRERMGSVDAIKVAQLAALFFATSSRAGSKFILK